MRRAAESGVGVGGMAVGVLVGLGWMVGVLVGGSWVGIAVLVFRPAADSLRLFISFI